MEYFIYMYVCVSTCMPGAHRGLKRALDLLELKLWMVGLGGIAWVWEIKPVGPLQKQHILLRLPHAPFVYSRGSPVPCVKNR